jgi:hemerythrin-like domain-containing protein
VIAKTPFDNPLQVLRDCHRRIETFMTALVRLNGVAKGAAISGEDREALRTALRYFREAVPKHTEDEEVSLFPRLRRQKDSRLLPVLARIESLEEEHVCCDRIHGELDAIGRLWLKEGSLPSPEASQLFALTAQLRDVYRHHLAIEEDEVFPAAATALAESEIRALANELAYRWGSLP